MIAHRFVQIHGIENRRVESGQQFLGDNQNLGRIAVFGKTFANGFFFLLVNVKFLEQRFVIVVPV